MSPHFFLHGASMIFISRLEAPPVCHINSTLDGGGEAGLKIHLGEFSIWKQKIDATVMWYEVLDGTLVLLYLMFLLTAWAPGFGQEASSAEISQCSVAAIVFKTYPKAQSSLPAFGEPPSGMIFEDALQLTIGANQKMNPLTNRPQLLQLLNMGTYGNMLHLPNHPMSDSRFPASWRKKETC